MNMLIRSIVVFAIVLLSAWEGKAQLFFYSGDSVSFPNEVSNALNRIDTESAKKVAYDFRSVWDYELTNQQKSLMLRIAEKMVERRLQIQPYHEYFYSYVTYAVEQDNIESNQLTKALEITREAVNNYDGKELARFLLSMNLYFAREYLYWGKLNYTKALGGTYSFENQQEFVEVEEPPVQEEVEEIEVIEQPAQDPWATDNSNDDSWANDPWGTTGDTSDPWADANNDDSWANDDPWSDSSSDDPWADNSSDSWSDDPWGTNTQTTFSEPQPQRMTFTPAVTDHVHEFKSKYASPVLLGPILKLSKTDIQIVTPYDSLVISKTSGDYELKGNNFVGKGGSTSWPDEFQLMREATVDLGDYYFSVHKPTIWTPNASLKFPSLFPGKVDGVFKYASIRMKNKQEKPYPYFESFYSDTEVSLPFAKVKYKGGITFHGTKMYGRSISRDPGRLEIVDGKGRKIVAYAVEFAFLDSMITSENAKITIYHGSDSIVHPGVSLSYDPSSTFLRISKSKGDYKNSAFRSSYYGMRFHSDDILWDMSTDSLDIKINSARNLVPTVFISKDYFSASRFRKYGANLGFHPVIVCVNYSKKYGTRKFYIDEVINEYKITESQAREMATIMSREGYAKYKADTRELELLDKSFQDYNANYKKTDFDHLLISSLLLSNPNATIRLDSNQVVVRGVDEFYLSEDRDLRVEPDSGIVILEQNRSLQFNGMVNAGDFQYKGKNFSFDYDQFLITMPEIDSIRIQVTFHDSTDVNTRDPEEKEALGNHITETSGTIFLNDPLNKSGNKSNPNYPYFVSDSDAVVYFDSYQYLKGAYDKSIKFIVPPFEMDSVNEDNASRIKFKGRLVSGIFPEFEEELIIMPDKTLGFNHTVPSEGYNLYNSGAKIYNEISLDGRGIRTSGQLDYLTTSIHSDQFTFYMDSVSARGSHGEIKPGMYEGASYPQVVIGQFRMKWLPKKDSMYIKNLGVPFEFYDNTATLDGEVNVTKNGVFGSGTMLTRGSRSYSNELAFSEFKYSARHAEFEILTDNPNKPAMAGDDISLNFDLTKNSADISPERSGVAAISFPYAQMKTSITEAVWDLEDSLVTMKKPPSVAIEDSYFYSTREELDSLVFNAEEAIYDINTFELEIKGIPYIIVADAKVTPANGETTILENSELTPLEDATVVIDTLNGYHRLFDGYIKILSRNKFEGYATYELVTAAQDTFEIQFNQFELKEVDVGEKDKRLMTVSGGEITARNNVEISTGFLYRGSATMYAYKKPLELDGMVKLMLKSFGRDYDRWVLYERGIDDEDEVIIDFDNSRFEDGDNLTAGLHYDIRGDIYPTFISDKKDFTDHDFFTPHGELRYIVENNYYQIETSTKTSAESYVGSTFIYDDVTTAVIFEGPTKFATATEKGFELEATVLGTGNALEQKYDLKAFMAFNWDIPLTITDYFTFDVADLIERLGAKVAHDNSIELMYNLANFIGEEATRTYEEEGLKTYIPLVESSEKLQKTLVISDVDLSWDSDKRVWYNTSNIGVSNILTTDINASMGGFMEIGQNNAAQDVINIFLQPAPGTWYFFGYEDHHLFMLSSNVDFNADVEINSNNGEAKPGELVILTAEVGEVLRFVNNFRKDHLGLDTPFDLELPDDIMLEDDENFDTIEDADEEDDGFGFK